MKENTKELLPSVGLRDILESIGVHAAVAAVSFLAARAPLLGIISPFGLSFAAGVPSPYILTAGLGAALGYFVPVIEGSAFRYFAALFAICTVKILLGSAGSFSRRPIWSVMTAFLITLLTALAAGGDKSIPVSAAEAVFAAAGGYFVHRTGEGILKNKNGPSPQQLACTVIVINIILTGLYPLSIASLSVGRIAAAAAILAVARYSHAFGGAIAGCSCALFLSLSSDFGQASVGLAVGGMLSGIFAPMGKAACAACLVVWSFICALLSGDSAPSYLLTAECAFGAAVFLLLPKKVCNSAGKLFAPPAAIPSLEGLKRALTMRLYFASSALADVSKTVEEVSGELKLINAPDFNWVLDGVKSDGCMGCSLKTYCWTTKNGQMHDAVLAMSRLIKAGEEHPALKAPDEFRERCMRPLRVENAVMRYYDEYSSRIAAEARIAEIRGVVSDQFNGISEMLYDLGEEFERCEHFDSATAARLSAILRDNGIHASDCAVKTDKYGRISIEMRICIPKSTVLNRRELLTAAEAVCEREFEAPDITRTKHEAFVSICEKARLSVDIGISQLVSGNGMVCGDAYTTFSDGKGRMYLLLSDGMGTGGRAAVDGAMASGLMERLLRAGFGYDCALRIVNSSMLFKSTDESLATVDIACIDLFTGKTELLKAGAAPTVIRRNGRSGKAQSTSLPAGILREVGFDRATVSLKEHDIVVIMSDGVTVSGTDWLCAEIEAYKNGNAQALAEKLAHSARQRRTDGHDDDITVIAAILQKAV